MTDRMREAPKPEVPYLKTIFGRITAGTYRIPAFQRGFVWTEAQILQLLESVFRGFPVGSVLLWKVDTEQLRVDHSGGLPIPEIGIKYPVSYLLDGLQRLTTLYGVFHQEQFPDGRFAAVFDLQVRRFLISEEAAVPPTCIRLSALFDARRLLEAQQGFLSQPEGETLVDRSFELLSAFQEYMIPVVTIEDRSVAEVVEIFERVNSTGTSLGKVDFMRAVTWSEEFDLGPELDLMSAGAIAAGFEVPEDTIIKLLGLGVGLEPTGESLMELRNQSPELLSSARDRVLQAMTKAFEFFAEDKIFGYDFVPYEGQLIVTTGLFLEPNPLTADQRTELHRWVRSVSLAESLRGKPDHYVSRALADLRQSFLVGGRLPPQVRVDLRPEDLVERRFTAGKALSAGIAALFANHEPLDLVSGEPIDASLFMSSFEPSNFAPLLSKQQLEEVLGRTVPSNRVIANVVVVTDASRNRLKLDPEGVLLAASAEARKSQLLPMTPSLLSGEDDAARLLSDRARLIHQAILSFVR